MQYAIYKDGKFTGHIGHEKNMRSIAQVLANRYPQSRVGLRLAKDQTATFSMVGGW